MAKCEKSMCGKQLYTCPDCKGRGVTAGGFGNPVHCSICGDTGQLCPDRGKYWKR